jgi:flagellar hook protein FlgE
MLGPLFSALSGLKNTSQRLQNSANNVANVNTNGFKKSDVNSVGNKSGGTRVNDISRSHTQGSLIPTGNSGAVGLGTVRSGFLEGSNVDITEEIADQIVSKVAFKANINVIKANNEMLGSILDIKS